MKSTRKASKGELTFYGINYLILSLLGIIMLLPFFHVVAMAFSDESAVRLQQVAFWPVGFNVAAFKYTLSNDQFLTSLSVSLAITMMGTAMGVLFTFMAAYPLSKPELKLRKPFVIFFVFTMMFGGGLIPSFILMKGLNLYNTIWALFLPGTFSAYNMLLVKNYLETLPPELEEAAKIDGASNYQVLFKVILPVAKPVLATITLFFAVGFWNSYFSGMFMISDPKLKPLQTYLYELVRMSTLPPNQLPPEIAMRLTTDGISSANIVVSTIPILLVYPFLQKYFVKGLVVGSVK